jgi:predicted MFS family arabinose efflux permease
VVTDTAVRRGLWTNADFRRFWSGDVVSQFGSRITEFVLPLLLVNTLDATAAQVGLLQALYLAPFFLLPLGAGLWLERRAKRPVMIAMDLGRLVLVMAVPVLALFGQLTLPLLFLIAVAGGAMTVVYDIAATSYVPLLVDGGVLASANSTITANQAASATAGPGIAGWLAGLFGPAATLIFDGLSYLASANALLRIRHREPVPRRRARDLRQELVDGLRAVLRNPPVRALASHAGIYNASIAMTTVAFLLYFVRELGHTPAAYGLVMVCGGLGGICGALGVPTLIGKLGYGRAMMTVLVFSTLSYFLLPAAGGGTAGIAVCAVAFFLGSMGAAGGSVIALTVRQKTTPTQLHARMNASYRMFSFGMLSLGSAVSGVLVDAIGARATLAVTPVLLLVSAIPAISRPVRTIGDLD